MSIIKRLSTTLVSSIDNLVADIENHDAVIQASLADMRKKITTATIRLNQIQRDERQLQERINTLQDQADKWRQRAIDTGTADANGHADETKAMACLVQRKNCLQQITQLEQERQQYQQVAHTLAQDIASSQQQLNDLSHKHRLLRARQSSAEAMQLGNQSIPQQGTLNDTFERWEIRIAQETTTLPVPSLIDPLETEFVKAEHAHALKAELAALLNGENHHAK